jgi:hypothetical protein
LHQLEEQVGIEAGSNAEDTGVKGVGSRSSSTPAPFSPFKLEGAAKKNRWFETRDRPNYGVTYHPVPKADDLSQRPAGYLGQTQSALDHLLDHLAKMKTDQAEFLATTFAAWNDLLIDSRPADEDAIIAEVYGWDESKIEFTWEQTIKCIG